MPPPILPWDFGPTGMVKGQPQEPAYSGPPGLPYDVQHAGEIVRGTEQNVQQTPFQGVIDYFSGNVGASNVPRSRAAVVWVVIIAIGIIGVSGLLRPGTNVAVRLGKGK